MYEKLRSETTKPYPKKDFKPKHMKSGPTPASKHINQGASKSTKESDKKEVRWCVAEDQHASNYVSVQDCLREEASSASNSNFSPISRLYSNRVGQPKPGEPSSPISSKHFEAVSDKDDEEVNVPTLSTAQCGMLVPRD